MMSRAALAIALAVAILNVSMNILVKQAASAGSWVNSIFSISFFVALLLGFGSLFSLLGLYLHAAELARAIIVMAGMSLSVGTMIGVIGFHNRIDIVDVGLLGVIMCLLIYRWISLA